MCVIPSLASLPWCAPAGRATRRSSSAVGAGVSATSGAYLTFQPVFSAICSRVTPGWMETTVSSLLTASGSMTHRSVTSRVGPLGRHAEPLAMAGAIAVAQRGDEIELVDERALALRHDDEHLAAGGGDLRRAAAARQPHLRLVVGADDRGVEVGEAVDLGAAEEADGDAAALQPVAEHLHHRHGGERRLAQLAVADRTAAARWAWWRWCRSRRSA